MIQSIFLNLVEREFAKTRVYVVLDGHCMVSFGEKEYHLVQHDIFISASKKFFFFNTVSADSLILEIDIDGDVELNNLEGLTDQVIYKANKNVRILENLYSLISLSKNNHLCKDNYDMNITYYLDKLLKEIYCESQISNYYFAPDRGGKNLKYIWQIFYDIMDNPLDDHRLSVKEKEYNVSYSQLSRNFKDIIGVKYNSFVTYMRLNRALEMLYTTDKTVLDISMAAGFNSSKAFHENFKKQVDSTPLQFRNKIINNTYDDFKYKSIDEFYDSKLIEDMIREYAIDITSDKDEMLRVYNYNYSQCENFLETRRAELDKNFILNVDSAERFTQSFIEGITSSELEITKLRFELLIGMDGDVNIYKNNKWVLLEIDDMIGYVSMLESYGKHPMVTLILKRELLSRKEKIIASLTNYLNVLLSVLGLQELSTWSFEFKLEFDCIINERCTDNFMDFLSNIIDSMKEKYNIDKIGANLGDLDRVNKDICCKNITTRLYRESRLSHLSFSIINNMYDGNDIFDYINLEKLLDHSYKTIQSISPGCHNNKKIYVSMVDLKGNYKYIPKKYIESVKAINLLIKLHWFIKTGVGIVKIEQEYLFNIFKQSNNDIKHISKMDISHGLFKYYINKDAFFKDTVYNTLKFIYCLQDRIYSYDDRLILSTDGTDYNIIVHLSYSDNYQSLIDAKDENGDANNLIKLSIPLKSGRYKLRTYTLNSKCGNIYSEMDKVGDPGDFDSTEMEYLERITMPRLEVEEITIDSFFYKEFKVEAFEIKFLNFIRIK